MERQLICFDGIVAFIRGGSFVTGSKQDWRSTWCLGLQIGPHLSGKMTNSLQQARKLQATLVRNYDLITRWRGWGVELLA